MSLLSHLQNLLKLPVQIFLRIDGLSLLATLHDIQFNVNRSTGHCLKSEPAKSVSLHLTCNSTYVLVTTNVHITIAPVHMCTCLHILSYIQTLYILEHKFICFIYNFLGLDKCSVLQTPLCLLFTHVNIATTSIEVIAYELSSI